METSSSALFSNDTTGRGSIWANIEQDYVSDSDVSVDMGTLMRMLTAVRNGGSAIEVVYQDCSYVKISGTEIIITLDFFVWPHDLKMDYTLEAPLGEISQAKVVAIKKSFDVAFSASATEDLPSIFEGTFAASMPIFTPDGKLSASSFYMEDNFSVHFNEAVTTVLRANGLVRGHAYTITMRFDKGTAENLNIIDSIDCQVVLTYVDVDNETVTKILTMKIPPCVEALLSFCDDGNPRASISCAGDSCNGEPILKVYYSTCKEDTVLKTVESTND